MRVQGQCGIDLLRRFKMLQRPGAIVLQAQNNGKISMEFGGLSYCHGPVEIVLLLAWRGRKEEATRAADEVIHAAVARGQGELDTFAHYALAVLYLGLGRYEAALAAAKDVYNNDSPYFGTHVLPDLVEAGTRPLKRRRESVGAAWLFGRDDELRLSAAPVGGDNQPPRDPIGGRGAKVSAYEVDAEVERGGLARGGEHVSFVDVENVRAHLDARVAPCEVIGVHPVRGRNAAVQQPGRSQHEGAGA